MQNEPLAMHAAASRAAPAAGPGAPCARGQGDGRGAGAAPRSTAQARFGFTYPEAEPACGEPLPGLNRNHDLGRELASTLRIHMLRRNNMVRRLSAVLLALTMAGLAACERPASDGLLGPESVSAPRAGKVAVPVVSPASNLSGVVLLQGDAATGEQTVSKIVYTTGKLTIGGNSLNIWRQPLDEPLVFTMTITQTPYIAAKLSAVKLSDGTPVTTFKAPLDLRLSYAGASTAVPNPSNLRVYYVVDGVVREQTVSAADVKGQTVYANIWHFSEYSPGLDGMQ